MSTIFVPIDGSEPSLKALQYAISLAQRTHDQIIIANVQPSLKTPNVQRFFSVRDIQNFQQELSQEALKDAIQLLDSHHQTYEKKILVGDAAHEISQAANAIPESVIVMGSRGAGAIKGKLLGSVSYGVLHEATCPVTIIK